MTQTAEMAKAKIARYRRVYREPVSCDRCGYTCEKDSIPVVTTLAGINGLATGDCAPEEVDVRCPRCKELASFQEAIRCSECQERPRRDEPWCLCDDPDAIANIREAIGEEIQS